MTDQLQISDKRVSFREEIAERAAMPGPMFRDLVSRNVAFFDQEWYEVQCGQRFESRAEAIKDAASKMRDSRYSPHPLFDFEWFRQSMRRRHSSVEPKYFLLFLPGKPVANPHPTVDLDAIALRHPEALEDPNGVFGWLLAFLGLDSEVEIPGLRNNVQPLVWSIFRADMMREAKAWRKEFESLRRAKPVRQVTSFDAGLSDAYIARIAVLSNELTEQLPKPLVSVVLYDYDTVDAIKAGLDSLRDQEMHSWELILVDQATGESHNLLKLPLETAPLRRLDAKHLSTGAALNWAVREAKGHYIAFLQPGYRWHPLYLQTMVRSLTAGNAKHGFSMLRDRIPGKASDRFHVRFNAETLLSGGTLCLSNWMVEKSVLIEQGFDCTREEACDLQAAWDVGQRVEPLVAPFVGVSNKVFRSVDSSALSAGIREVWLEKLKKSTHLDSRRLHTDNERRPGISAIVVWKEESHAELVDSLRSLTSEGSGVSEIVVVGAKTERSRRFAVQSERSLASVDIKFEIVPSASSALLANIGFALSTFDRVLFLCPGTEFDSGQVQQLALALTADVAVVQPALVDRNRVVIALGHQYISTGMQKELPAAFLEGHHQDDLTGINPSMPAAGASLKAMLVRADSFFRLDGFAAELPERWFDVDYSLRAKRDLGQRTLVLTSVPVTATKFDYSQSSFWATMSTRFFMAQWPRDSKTAKEDIWRSTPYALLSTGYDSASQELTDRWTPRPILQRRLQLNKASPDLGVIAIKHCGPGGPQGERWGDTFFARQLAGAMEALGHQIYVDNKASARRSSTYLDDVNIAIRGRYKIPAVPGALNVLWIISHPELVQPDELTGFDLVYAASESWAIWASRRYGVEVRPLLQATDVNHFRRTDVSTVRSADVLVVGNRRWEYDRPSVAGLALIGAGLERGIYGEGWAGEPELRRLVLGEYIDNDDLPDAYSKAKVVLNDHHPTMRQSGFINNRIFDALAVGTPVISDTITGGLEIFGDRVKWYDSLEEIPALIHDIVENPWSEVRRLEVVDWIRKNHSLQSRALSILGDLKELH